jgi:fatty-acyl-CoA synthase
MAKAHGQDAMSATQMWIRALSYTKSASDQTLPGIIDHLAETYATQPALIEAGYKWPRGTIRSAVRGELTDFTYTLSYLGLSRRVNRYARWAIAQRLGKGDVVSLLMPNRIDYVALWLALTRIGCTVALLNTNLRGEALHHCIKTAGSTMVIVSDGLSADYLHFVPFVDRVWNWDVVRDETQGYSPDPLTDIAQPKPNDHALLIYTSGTTGWPKATVITHRRIIEWSYWFAGMMDTQPSDRLYNCLPMYHSIGGIVAIGAMLVKGGSVFIRARFSTSRFWDDVVDQHCTIFQYIGELCRYLTQSETHPKEQDHQLRLACGNGLQGDVWPIFQARFAIPQILEFYAATEGNLSLYNCEGKPGAIGRVPSFLAHNAPQIIRCDQETGEPTRDGNGLCIPCAIDEPGEAISRLGQRRFDGYTDTDASQRKVLRDVFAVGDQWFRSGDLMRKDAGGYYYFVDRLGDTFRWKGENVATTEVAAVLRGAVGVTDAVVYGVTVAGHEGRAGMAALTTTVLFSFATLYTHLQTHLPEYAQPLFIRLCKSLDMTGTFKLPKTDLSREGYTHSTDPIWRKTQTGYEPLGSGDKPLSVID